MTFSLTLEQFAALKANLSNAADCNLIQLTQETGTLTVQGVTLDYGYDGSTLTVKIAARHGLAAFDSESDIEKRLTTRLNEFIQGEPA